MEEDASRVVGTGYFRLNVQENVESQRTVSVSGQKHVSLASHAANDELLSWRHVGAGDAFSVGDFGWLAISHLEIEGLTVESGGIADVARSRITCIRTSTGGYNEPTDCVRVARDGVLQLIQIR